MLIKVAELLSLEPLSDDIESNEILNIVRDAYNAFHVDPYDTHLKINLFYSELWN